MSSFYFSCLRSPARRVRRTSHGDEPAPKPFHLDLSTGRVIDTPPEALFASVPPPRGRAMRFAAAAGVVLALLLPLGLLIAEAQHVGLLHLGRPPGFHAPVGALSVRSRPDGAEVYIDGALRGVAPLQLELPAGTHALRVGSPTLERWRATSVNVKVNTVHALEVVLFCCLYLGCGHFDGFPTLPQCNRRCL